MTLPRFSLRYKPIVIAAVTVAMVGGLIKFATMPRRADPEFTIRIAQVITRWPGAETERVEQLVTFPLEQEIKKLQEVDFVRSTTWTGLSIVYVELIGTLPPETIQQVWERVRAKVDNVRPNLPAGVADPIVNDDFADTAVMLITIYEKGALGRPAQDDVVAGDGRGPNRPRYTPRQLEVVSDRIRERIALLPAVGKAELHGVRQEVIYLETPGGNWANLDLSFSDLEQLLKARNIYAGGGSFDTARSRFGVQPSGEFDTVAQIEGLVVRRDSAGAPVYLKDLGIRVRRGYEDPPRILTRHGNPQGEAPCVVLSFTMKDGFKVTDLGAEVRTLLHDLQHRDGVIPPDVAVDVVFDESLFVENKIADFMNNVIQAIVIVVLVAFLLSGFRPAVVMATAIPFVMVISIGLSATFAGVQLEQMSLASLIIALGMLVDNAVVVTDNVRRFQTEGYGRVEAVVKGVEQIQYPILMGTLTTVFAFLPLAFFLSAERAEYIFSIPAVVSITLLTSWVLALTITTLMTYWIIRPQPAGQEEKSPVVWLAEKLRGGKPPKEGSSIADRYESLVHLCLRTKPLVIGLAVVLVIGAGMLPVGTEFFPNDKRDVFYVDVWLPEGASLEATNQATLQVEQILRRISRVETSEFTGERLAKYYSSVGGSGPRFAPGVDPQPPASNFAQIIGRTTNPSVSDRYVSDIRAAAEKALPGARVIPRKLSLGPPTDSPLGIRLFGTGFTNPGFADEAELRRQASRVKAVFQSIEGVWDVHDVWGEPGYQLDVKIDQDRANLAGVTNAAVAESFSAYYSGRYLTTYREGDHQLPVYFRLPPEERGSISDPRSIFVEGVAGKVPIDAVAALQPRRKTIKIERRKNNRMIEVRARVEPGILSNDKLAEAWPKLKALEATFPPSISLEVAGEYENTQESQGEMRVAFGIALVLIVLTLIVQYNSLVKPFIVLLTVPMGAAGALVGLWVTGNPLGFMPTLGLVSLAGIVVNSGILYIEFAETLLSERIKAKQGLAKDGEKSYTGLTRQAFQDCLAQAGKTRLLPIFLTVSTTVGGLIPLALFGGPMWEGMAYLLIFGLIIATVLTLLVLPAIYAAFVEYAGVKTVQVDEAEIDTPG